jgi:hypothetical protein
VANPGGLLRGDTGSTMTPSIRKHVCRFHRKVLQRFKKSFAQFYFPIEHTNNAYKVKFKEKHCQVIS